MNRLIPTLLMLVAAPVAAQSPSTDQAALPDISQPPSGSPGWKYFFLHKPGIGLDEALRDFRDCYPQIEVGDGLITPAFVPWRRADAARPQVITGGSYGLVGIAIASMLMGPINRSFRQMRLARCMLPRGYSRYPLSKEVWQQINSGDQERSIMVQAKMASGPAPTSARMIP